MRACMLHVCVQICLLNLYLRVLQFLLHVFTFSFIFCMQKLIMLHKAKYVKKNMGSERGGGADKKTKKISKFDFRAHADSEDPEQHMTQSDQDVRCPHHENTAIYF